jgi:hypothetical protein
VAMLRLDRPTVAELWTAYGRHAGVILGHGPAPTKAAGDGWSVQLSGANHVDLNQVVLFGAADQPGLEDALGRAVGAGVPVLVAESSSLTIPVAGLLESAGFIRLPNAEALFWSARAPEPLASSFEIRRATIDADMAAIRSIFREVHGYEEDLLASMYGHEILADPALAGWLAFDGDEPVSCAFVTSVDQSLGLFEVMTPDRHRRRGAARALVSTALSATAARSQLPVTCIVFWASPAGLPLYEALGFAMLDRVTAWTLGASVEDLAAVGAG